MHPGLNLSMQHIPNTEHYSEATDQGDPNHTSFGMQLPSVSGVDVVKRPVQEVFVVDLTKINGSFGISLTVFIKYFLFLCFSIKRESFYLFYSLNFLFEIYRNFSLFLLNLPPL